MVGSGGAAAASRNLAVDRFYSPPHVRRHQIELLQQQQRQQQPASSLSPSPSPSPPPPVAQQQQQQRPGRSKARPAAPSPAHVEVEARVESDDVSSKPSVSSSPSPSPTLSPSFVSAAEDESAAAVAAGNLQRFIRATTPVVSALFPSKISVRESNIRDWRSNDAVDSNPYYLLCDLWESFKEWSAYGAGVPIVLDGSDVVVQYYVPYLSAIQLYADPLKISMRSRRSVEGSDGEISVDTSSEGSIGSEVDRLRLQSLSIGNARQVDNCGSLSDDGEGVARSSPLIFEYLERGTPYGREPLTDKISILARECSYLKNLHSCDLLPSSWMSIAWYPIYRIPTGPTLKDLDACFLTFHQLATAYAGSNSSPTLGPAGYSSINDQAPDKFSLPVFGLASYKYRSSVWASEGSQDQFLAQTLLQAADNWLQKLQVDHPDFRFFISHYNAFGR